MGPTPGTSIPDSAESEAGVGRNKGFLHTLTKDRGKKTHKKTLLEETGMWDSSFLPFDSLLMEAIWHHSLLFWCWLSYNLVL